MYSQLPPLADKRPDFYAAAEVWKDLATAITVHFNLHGHVNISYQTHVAVAPAINEILNELNRLLP